MRVLVIGGGAAGLMAAVHAAKKGAAVTVLEGSDKPGRKLLTTGNGRCNLTNLFACERNRYRSEQPDIVRRILLSCPPKATLEQFASFGLFVQEKEGGGIYPASNQAATVLDILLSEAGRAKVKIKCREKVRSLTFDGAVWKAATDGWTYEADRVILACGSRAASVTGSDGSGYELAKSVGHHLITPLPALVPLKTKESDTRALDGLRCRAAVSLYEDQKKLSSFEGELQWTSYGVSGIVIFQVSRFAVRALQKKRRVSLSLDLLTGLDEQLLKRQMAACCDGRTNEEVLSGLFARKLALFLLKRSSLRPDAAADTDSVDKMLTTAGNVTLEVIGSKDFEAAQVCSGGVSLLEIHPETMESRLAPGLYLAGELLDADGPCGGYNLQWAWTTGSLAGDNAGGEKKT